MQTGFAESCKVVRGQAVRSLIVVAIVPANAEGFNNGKELLQTRPTGGTGPLGVFILVGNTKWLRPPGLWLFPEDNGSLGIHGSWSLKEPGGTSLGLVCFTAAAWWGAFLCKIKDTRIPDSTREMTSRNLLAAQVWSLMQGVSAGLSPFPGAEPETHPSTGTPANRP